MATRIPLILNRATARIEELAVGDLIPGGLVDGMFGRNIVINGDFRFWQRGTGFTAMGYGADRFLNNINGITCSMTRLSLGVGEIAGFKYACRMSFNGGSNPTHYVTLQHRMENLGYYSGKTLTFSGYMRANTAGLKVAFECALVAAGGTIPGGTPSNAIGVTTFTLGTAWQKFTATFTVPSLVGATFNDNSSLSFNLWLSAGSNHDSRNNNLGFQSGIVDFAGLQLEEGSAATPFEYRSDALELMLCQRYYQKSYSATTSPGSNTNEGRYTYGNGANTNQINRYVVPFRTPMRKAPSIVSYGAPSGTAGVVSQADGSNISAVIEAIGESAFTIGWNNTNGQWGGLFHWAADAEI